jgi:hypothetical protein
MMASGARSVRPRGKTVDTDLPTWGWTGIEAYQRGTQSHPAGVAVRYRGRGVRMSPEEWELGRERALWTTPHTRTAAQTARTAAVSCGKAVEYERSA